MITPSALMFNETHGIQKYRQLRQERNTNCRYLHWRNQTDALREIVLFSSPVLDAGLGSEGNPEEPSGAEGSGRYGRNHGRCFIRCLALHA